MKKRFLPLALLLSINALQALQTESIVGAVAAVGTIVGLQKAADWKGDENPEGSILGPVGAPFGLSARGTLKVLNTAGALTALGCLSSPLRDTALTAGGVGAAKLAFDALTGNFDQKNKALNPHDTIKWTLGGAVLHTVYRHVGPVNNFVNGLLGNRFGR